MGKNKLKEWWLDAPGLAFCLARSKRPRLVLAPAVTRVLAPHALLQICKYETLK
jgi:hypothetical protein